MVLPDGFVVDIPGSGSHPKIGSLYIGMRGALTHLDALPRRRSSGSFMPRPCLVAARSVADQGECGWS
jgi:hypothetical protein